MFVSAGLLGVQYGVDDKIARFFVDRDPPANNLYWKDKLLYLRPEVGWLFIPLIVDLFYKLGIDRHQLLSDKFIEPLEAMGHLSALEETGQLTEAEAINEAYALVKNGCVNEWYLQWLMHYFNGNTSPYSALATPYKALHRGDLFLFSLGGLSFSEEQSIKLVEFWFALITTILLLDDAEDLENDKLSGDKNAFIEAGGGKEGVNKLLELVRTNLQKISTVNRAMALKLDSMIKEIYNKPNLVNIFNQ
ncbi:MAG: hypothetical protein JWQ96_1727 [Segetibacter sp.]|nr:hypothetical protein [Segetibacter sp.]